MSTQPRDKRVRLSLECSAATKEEFDAHGTELGQWSMIGGLRAAVRRSKKFFDLEKRGTLLLQRHEDGGIEEIEK